MCRIHTPVYGFLLSLLILSAFPGYAFSQGSGWPAAAPLRPHDLAPSAGDTVVSRTLFSEQPLSEGDSLQLLYVEEGFPEPERQIRIEQQRLVRDAQGNWVVRFIIPGSLDRPGARRLRIYAPGAAVPKARFIFQVRPPAPAVHRVAVLSDEAASAGESLPIPALSETPQHQPPATRPFLQLRPDDFLVATLRITGGPFYKGARVAFIDAEAADRISQPEGSVSVISRDVLHAVVHVRRGEDHQPNVGHYDLKVENPNQWPNPNASPGVLLVKGDPPLVEPLARPLTRPTDGRLEITLKGRNFSDRPRLQIMREGAGGRTYPLDGPAPAEEGSTRRGATFRVFIPPVPPGTEATYTLTLINEDGQRGTQRFRVRPPSGAELAAYPLNADEALYYGIETTMAFEVPRANDLLFSPEALSRYRLEVPDFPGVVFTPLSVSREGRLLTAIVHIADPRGPRLEGEVLPPPTLPFKLVEEHSTRQWTGDLKIARRPRIVLASSGPAPFIDDGAILLRPGEERLFLFKGENLKGAYLQGSPSVKVGGSDLPGHVTLADLSREAGTRSTLDLKIGNQTVGTLAVSVQPWTPMDYLQWQWRTGDAAPDPEQWQTWSSQDVSYLDQGSTLWFRADSTRLQDGLEQALSLQLQKPNGMPVGGTIDLVASADTSPVRSIAIPGDFSSGEAFRVEVRRQDGLPVTRNFRLKRSHWDRISISAGIPALQMPLNGDPILLFRGVNFGINYSLDRRDFFALNFGPIFTKPDADSPIRTGVSLGLLLDNKLLIAMGMQRQPFLLVGGSIGLSSLRSLLGI